MKHRPRHMRRDDRPRARQIRATAWSMVGVGLLTLSLVAGLVAGQSWTQQLEADMADHTTEVQP